MIKLDAAPDRNGVRGRNKAMKRTRRENYSRLSSANRPLDGKVFVIWPVSVTFISKGVESERRAPYKNGQSISKPSEEAGHVKRTREKLGGSKCFRTYASERGPWAFKDWG